MRRAIVKRFASVFGLVAALTFGVVDTARGQDDAAKKNCRRRKRLQSATAPRLKPLEMTSSASCL